MLEAIDRVQLAVFDPEEAAKGWFDLLGARFAGDDRIDCLGAKRSTYRLGSGTVEFLSPDGDGAVSEALKTRGRPHLFAAGASTADYSGLLAHLRDRRAAVDEGEGEAYVHLARIDGGAFRIAIRPQEERDAVGAIDFFYETTLLVPDHRATTSTVADLFDLDTEHLCPIRSEHFGYEGALTLFYPDRLHRFEIITPTDFSKTMGRYFAKSGPVFYMAFAETAAMIEIEDRAKTAGAGLTVERPEGRTTGQPADQMWLHPPVLGGMMLGLSRPSMAWSWSGRPDRVEQIV